MKLARGAQLYIGRTKGTIWNQTVVLLHVSEHIFGIELLDEEVVSNIGCNLKIVWSRNELVLYACRIGSMLKLLKTILAKEPS